MHTNGAAHFDDVSMLLMSEFYKQHGFQLSCDLAVGRADFNRDFQQSWRTKVFFFSAYFGLMSWNDGAFS